MLSLKEAFSKKIYVKASNPMLFNSLLAEESPLGTSGALLKQQKSIYETLMNQVLPGLSKHVI